MTDNHSIIHNCKQFISSFKKSHLKKSHKDHERRQPRYNQFNICNIENCVIKYNNCSSINTEFIDLIICSDQFKKCNDSSLLLFPNIDDDDIMSSQSDK